MKSRSSSPSYSSHHQSSASPFSTPPRTNRTVSPFSTPPRNHQSYISPSSTPPRSHHMFSETMTQENIDSAEDVIRRWDLDARRQESFTPLFEEDRTEARRLLEAVSSLHKAMQYYVKMGSSSDNLIRAQKLMQIAIKRLEKEFYAILSSNRKNLESESVSGRSPRASTRTSITDIYEDDVVSEEEENSTTTSTPPHTPPRGGSPMSDAMDIATANLKSIADCMIQSGYTKECVNIYKIIRKSIIDETLYYLGVERLNNSQMQKMEWNVLEPKVKAWLHAVKVAVKTLFHGERILCDAVFSFNEKIAESCFAEISRDAALQLFSFPENFAKSKKILSPEKMFRTLDLYEAISGMWPDIDFIFSYESLAAVRSEAEAALVKLAEAVRLMLTQFEAAIQKDASKSTPGGGVHPLTRYVMNYLVFLGDYSGAVADILANWQVTAHTPLPESYFSSHSPIAGGGEDTAATVSARLAWLILVLLCKLDSKAVLYDDVALSYLFLANNLNYVVSKVRSSNLGLLIGSDWIWKHGSKVKQYLANYERMGWHKVICALPDDPTADISPQQVTQYFRRFYYSFEETYRKQSSWVIPDSKIRDEVKISLSKKIVSGYRVFYQKHRETNTREFGAEPIVRYAPEDLDNYLSDLFFSSGSGSGSSKALSR